MTRVIGSEDDWDDEDGHHVVFKFDDFARRRETGSAETSANLADLTGWEFSDLRPFLDRSYERPLATIGHRSDGVGMLYPGLVNGIHGPSESGKSWLALLLCVEEVRTGQSVLYIDYEDFAGNVISRLRQLGLTPQEIAARFHYVSPQASINDRARALLEPVVRAASLVIVDATTEALAMEGLGSNDDTDIAEFSTRLPRWLAGLGPAVLLIDHVPKDKDKHDSGPTGSQHKRSSVQGASYLVRPVASFAPGGDDGRSRVLVSKDRLGSVREASLPGRGNGPAWFADFAIDASDPDAIRAAIERPEAKRADQDARRFEIKYTLSQALQDEAKPLSQTRWIRAARKLGAKGDDALIRECIDDLVSEKYVKQETGARGSKVHTHVRPFVGHRTEPDEDVPGTSS